MKPTIFSTLLCLGISAGLSTAKVDGAQSIGRRAGPNILIDPAAMPDLPTMGAAKAAASAVGLNLSDIQGDILIGMRKNKELFYFFSIANATDFKAKLRTDILPLVTSTTQLLSTAVQPTTALNIAFSQTGLTTLGITEDLGDPLFAQGQFQNAALLGDSNPATNWESQFAGTSIHGVILLASDTVDNVNASLASIQSALGSSITEVYSLQGAARPGAEQGHEHFGYLDGISNPAVQGFQTPLPGQAVVATGEILLNETGDSVTTRPAWAKDGSFLAFRQLQQLVPEFNKFLTDNPIRAPALTRQQGSDLLGARMIGRWKSGAPVFLSPLVDNPALGADPTRNNNFTYAAPGQNVSDPTDQEKCPFSAHIRKTRPRADLGLPESQSSNHHIVRGGIPYGPEVTTAEASSNTTQIDRGLAFVGYQSNIGKGFQFLQKTWANNPKFVHPDTGIDPIIGALAGAPRNVSGLDLTNALSTTTLTMGEMRTDFVVSRGGEYFFSPSLSAIANTLSV
ncbi:fungal peroxidase [Mycena pura]|uniref:Fungal peroxidase n=1 Tax=Mycena pura TaxID=153505 RepID=A0AAD6V431_9AGAR|nr:fungal peroxidase [Mycena pura]